MFLSEPETTPATERVHASTKAAQGFVMNLARAWAWRPDVFESFAALRAQLTSASGLSKRDQAVLICAMASQLGDAYCSLAWGKTLAGEAGAGVAQDVIADGMRLPSVTFPLDDVNTAEDVESQRRHRP